MELWLSRIYVSKPILCVVINNKKNVVIEKEGVCA